MTSPRVLVVMGVSGSGKTTVARLLAQKLGWPFEEGDELHPVANIDKMRAGVPLDDADRAPWLACVARWIDTQLATGDSGVIACSALKRAYRDALVRPRVTFVYLHADPATLAARLEVRHHAFMPRSLLASQLATLEEPGADEPVLRVEAADAPEHIVAAIIARL